MFCPKCGKINPDTEERCSGCNAVLKEQTAPVAEKKNRKVLKTVLVTLSVAIVIAAIVFFCCSCGHSVMPDINDRITY